MNINVPSATYAAVSESTGRPTPEQLRALREMGQKQRQELFEANGFDPVAILANLARVGVEGITGIPGAIKTAGQLAGNIITETGYGQRSAEFPSYPPTAVAIGRGVKESLTGAWDQVKSSPGKFIQENPDVPLSAVGAGLGMIGKTAGMLRKVETGATERALQRGARAEELARPRGAGAPARPDLDPAAWNQYQSLPRSEQARLDRAVEQGFTLEGFHGASRGLKGESFDPGYLGDATGAKSARLGFFFSRDPETAESYTFATGTNLKHEPELKKLYKRLDNEYYNLNDQLSDKNLEQFVVAHINKRMTEIENEQENLLFSLGGPNILPVKLKISNPFIYLISSYASVPYGTEAYLKATSRIIVRILSPSGIIVLERWRFGKC